MANNPSLSEISYLKSAIVNTPYSALIKQTEVNVEVVSDDDSIVRIIISAEVIETFRGDEQEFLQYEMIVEKGERVDVESESMVVILCKQGGRYFWPGTGAMFSNNKIIIENIRNTVKTLDLRQVEFDDCE
tara:strand:- start:277 stop:669 length:393 start_codon:yes stop_codon:yes gene_type:complete